MVEMDDPHKASLKLIRERIRQLAYDKIVGLPGFGRVIICFQGHKVTHVKVEENTKAEEL